ncbi:Dyp-type peroxidase [Jiangella sp. DSM 45060]|uniref:Dyp-type peroxidase n=1 Tax=Jiangella sp. DSM 45060 TaxID=1798224 RepID=UPI00087CDB8B|nr:Dyp-type peroxidase [Jiangella sp. DSM 45060]SDT72529.1 dye decolorizing peroxidase [Jiangella sp. DSM 45060]
MTEQTTDPASAPGGRTRRRDLLRGVAAAGAAAGFAGVAGLAAGRATADDGERRAAATPDTPPAAPTGGRPDAVDAAGPHQAGIARPSTPQPHGQLLVLDLVATPAPTAAFRDAVRALCARLGTAILDLTGERAAEAGLLDGPGDLTATVGLGPRVVAAFGDALPGAQPLPAFAADASVPPERTGGDLLIAVYASDPNDAHRGASWLAERAAPDAVLRWSQRGFRAPGTGTIARNPLGFHDGVIVPRNADEQDEHVWIADGPLAGGSICVVRRLRLDAARFTAEPVDRQEAVIGRHRNDGSPLSGGGPTGEVDLLAKTPDGQYVTPARSHVRAAHPSVTGSALMLRRGYAFDDGAADAGLLFVCFQRDLRTFVQTQFRLDEVDDLSAYVTPTGSATFLVLPGFDADHPLGVTLP